MAFDEIARTSSSKVTLARRARSDCVSLTRDNTRAKKAQVGVFVLVALVIVAGIAIFFIVRNQIYEGGISPELAPVYDYYQSCIESETRAAVQIAGAQGGRINVGEYFPGSDFAPFSSHLNFLGTAVPYWYYISANGLIKENVPSKNLMEEEIAEYVKEGLGFCDFESFYAQGFEIQKGEEVVNVDVLDGQVVVDVSSELRVSRGVESAVKNSHSAEVDSKLGKFYDLATEIYAKQKEEAFLEKYAVDVLYLYAPVDGVEVQCGPKIWATEQVIENLKTSFENNFAEIKFEGNYYELSDEKKEYFVLDKNVDEAVNVIYSRNWPTKIEIQGEGVDESVMMAEPIGTQEGLGTMGFCYVPYHFVYDVSFPAMIQIYDNEQFFQFPVAVIIDNNVARQAELSDSLSDEADFDLCEYQNKPIQVNLLDVNLNPVDANLSYECFDQRCRLGQSSRGVFKGLAPTCVNGFIHARAEGYAEKKQIASTNSQSFFDIVLEREHKIKVEVDLGGREAGTTIVSFTRDDGKVASASLPEFDEVELSEGNYEVKVYAYGNSSVSIPASTKYECVEVPKEGLLGFFGGTKEKCFDITIPETKLDYSLIGGGTSNYYILESELREGKVTISAEPLPTPRTLDEMQRNFEIFETRRLNLVFDEN